MRPSSWHSLTAHTVEWLFRRAPWKMALKSTGNGIPPCMTPFSISKLTDSSPSIRTCALESLWTSSGKQTIFSVIHFWDVNEAYEYRLVLPWVDDRWHFVLNLESHGSIVYLSLLGEGCHDGCRIAYDIVIACRKPSVFLRTCVVLPVDVSLELRCERVVLFHGSFYFLPDCIPVLNLTTVNHVFHCLVQRNVFKMASLVLPGK